MTPRGLRDFTQLERVLAGVLALTPLILIAFDSWSIRSSISAYYDMEQNQWYYYLLTVGSMLLLVNGTIKRESYYNVALGVLLAGVILFNQDDWTVIHAIFAITFFAGNAIVIVFFSRGDSRIKWTLVGIGVVLLAMALLFSLSLFWIEWLSLAIIAAHFILDSTRADYHAVSRGDVAFKRAS
jgi:hypothetical protein